MKSTNELASRAVRTSFALVTAVLWFTSPRIANAEPVRYRFELHAPKHLQNCNDPAGLREELRLALAHPLLEPPASRVLDVRIDRPFGGDYAVKVTLMDLEGHALESFTHAYPGSFECFKVLHKVALLAAIEMQKDLPARDESPATTTSQAPPAAASSPSCPAAPPCPVCETPRPAPPKPTPIERHRFVGAGWFVSFGAAPATVVGVQLVGGWRPWRSLSFELDVRGTFPADAVLAMTPFRVYSVLSVAFAPCYRVGAFGACVRGVFSNSWVERLTLPSSDVETFQAVGIGPRVLLEKRLAERWTLRIDGDLVLPFALPSNDDEAPQRWARPPINGGASVSILASF